MLLVLTQDLPRFTPSETIKIVHIGARMTKAFYLNNILCILKSKLGLKSIVGVTNIYHWWDASQKAFPMKYLPKT